MWLEKLQSPSCGCPVKFKLLGICDRQNKPNDDVDFTLLFTERELRYLLEAKVDGCCDDVKVWQPADNPNNVTAVQCLRRRKLQNCDICKKLNEITRISARNFDVHCQDYKIISVPSRCGCNHARVLQALSQTVVPHEIKRLPKTIRRTGQEYSNFTCKPVHRGTYHVVRPTLLSDSVAVKYLQILGNFCPTCELENQKVDDAVFLDDCQFNNFKNAAKKLLSTC